MKLKMAWAVVCVLWLFSRQLFQFCNIQCSDREVMKIVLFWDVTPSVLVLCSWQSFGETAPWRSSEMSPPVCCQTATRCHFPADHKMNRNFYYNGSCWEGNIKMDLQDASFLKCGPDSCDWWFCGMPGFCERGNERLGSVSVGKFFTG